jgi:hypothetical protein
MVNLTPPFTLLPYPISYLFDHGQGFWFFNFVRLGGKKKMAILFDIYKLAKLVESNSCSFLNFFWPNIGKKIISNKIAMFLLHICSSKSPGYKRILINFYFHSWSIAKHG